MILKVCGLIYPTVTTLDIISRHPGLHGKIVTEIIMSESNSMHHRCYFHSSSAEGAIPGKEERPVDGFC